MSAKKNSAPEGKAMATVKVGSKGQIVIPKEVRDIFNIEPGDTLMMLADEKQGIAMQPMEQYQEFIEQLLQAKENPQEAE